MIGGFPFGWDSNEDLHHLNKMAFTKIAREAYAEKGVYLINLQATDPQELLMAKRVDSLAELRKMKLRAVGAVAQWLKLLGVKTTYIPFEEVYTSLATGIVSGVILGGATNYSTSSMPEVAKFYYPQSFNTALNYSTIINLKLWNSLPKDIQAIIQLCIEGFWTPNNRSNAKGSYEIGQRILKEKFGCEYVYFPESDIKEMKAAAAELLKKEAAKSPRCAKLAKIMLDYRDAKGYPPDAEEIFRIKKREYINNWWLTDKKKK
jgi:TRAP-type C4-dicarboxylate transport system substrate-binding protein